jgi:adenylosuccinate synthase
MGCTIVVGGQYGSEGKGKVVALITARATRPYVVRCGGPNSGHTAFVRGREVVLRQVPAGAGRQDALLLLSAGCVVDEDLLLAETSELGLSRERVVVDPRAVLLRPEDRVAEQSSVARIGSTASGTGAALVRRMLRAADVPLAGASRRLRERVTIEPVAPLVHTHLDSAGDVVVEGTQGFGLSLLHSPSYPYATSRDTTASGFAMEVGLSPRDVASIVMVIRTFPIRVGGNSGPLAGELTWEDVRASSGAPAAVPEYTSVTKRPRRVGRFDLDLVRMAFRYNRPTSLAVMGLDRLDHSNTAVRSRSRLTEKALAFLETLESALGARVGWTGTGFRTEDAFISGEIA